MRRLLALTTVAVITLLAVPAEAVIDVCVDGHVSNPKTGSRSIRVCVPF